MAIIAFIASARSQTRGRVATEPTITPSTTGSGTAYRALADEIFDRALSVLGPSQDG